MSKITRECTDLLSKHSEIMSESHEILSELSELSSNPPKNNSLQRINDLVRKNSEFLRKADFISERFSNLLEISEPNLSRLPTIGKIIKEKYDTLCDKEDEMYMADEKIHKLLWEKQDDEQLQELLMTEKKLSRTDKKIIRTKRADKKIIRTKQADKNLGTKTALYLSSILALSLAYLTSKK